MNTTSATATFATRFYAGGPNFLRRTEAWLDDKGRGAWIAAMVLGFVFFWPIGLALVLYITITNRWSNSQMFGHSQDRCATRRAHWGQMRGQMQSAARSTGNSAFDAYKKETLGRLEEEQEAFEAFLQRLCDAKDKTEFDTFMDDRTRAARTAAPVEPALVDRPGEY
jgi:hypothetical protein